VTIGERVGSGREADVWRWDDTTVLKLWRDPALVTRADQEQRCSRLAVDAGAPAPHAGARLEVDGRPGLLLEFAPGDNLNQVVGAQPWRLATVAARLARLQVSIHALEAPPSLPRLADAIAVRLADGLAAGAGARPSAAARDALRSLTALPSGDRLCHGNLHLANVIGDLVIDWGDASRGDPHAEIAQTIVRYHVARLRAGSATGRTLPAESLGRSLLRRSYLRAYAKMRPVDRALLRRWIPIRAAERLTEQVPGEAHVLERLARG
jgi:hypothetical protein